MIKRYFFAGNTYVQGVRWTGKTFSSGTRVRSVYTCSLKGEAGATVTVTIQNLFFSYGSLGLFQVDGVNKVVGNTFTVTLDGAGVGSCSVNIGYVTGTVPDGEIAEALMQITSVTSGAVGAPDTISVDKTVG